MKPRERLIRILNRQPIDRVPVSTYELCGFNSRSFENNQPSYRALMDLIRQQTDCVCMWDPGSDQQAALSAYPLNIRREVVEDPVYTTTRDFIETRFGTLTSTRKVSPRLNTTWQIEHLCKDEADVDAYLSIPYQPLQYDFSDYSRIRTEVADQGIIMSSLADPICVAMELMDFADAMVWAMTRREHFARTVALIKERLMHNLTLLLQTQTVDLYRIVGSEYISEPYLPPDIFRTLALPALSEMVDLIHAHGAKVRIHSHGRLSAILEPLLDAGADALDPCEAPPDGDLDLAALVARTPGNLVLFGNIQLKLLEHGSPDEVRKAVQTCMEAAKETGRLVIMPTASPIDIPLQKKTAENYRVFIETALATGRYS